VIFGQVEGNYISPRVLSGRLHIPPVSTLIVVLAGGGFMGLIGVLVAIPLASTLPVLGRIWLPRTDGNQRLNESTN
jgi:predicted PurR-regulated permease PerM